MSQGQQNYPVNAAHRPSTDLNTEIHPDGKPQHPATPVPGNVAPVPGAAGAGRPREHRALPRWFAILMNTPIYPALLVIAVLCFWQFVVAPGLLPGVPTRYVGSPLGAWHSFIQLSHDGYQYTSLWGEISASLVRILLGFAIGAGAAMPVGLLMGMYDPIGKLVGPVLGFLRPIPALAFIPVVVIWFGIGQTGRITVIAITAFLYTVLGVNAGVRDVPKSYLQAAANFRIPRIRTLRSVVFPAALPQIMTGLRTGMAISWAVVVAAELIAAQQGLGYMIENASTFFQVNVVYVGIALIGVIGVLMEVAFAFLSRRILHWVGK